jgi:cytochrome c551/c552
MPPRRSRAAAAAALGVPALAVALLSYGADGKSANAKGQGKDAPPVVQITVPANDSMHAWNSLVSYGVVVSYQGKSTEYQEIPASEVLVQATYVPDLAAAAAKPAAAAAGAPPGLLDIVDSNCIGCHEFKAKAMGPSFAAIAERYPDSPATIGVLSQHIRVGSTGVWGQGSMPAHPDLTDDQLHDIVLWILKEAANPNVSYYVGTEGAIRMQASGTPGANAGMVLTASYTSPAPAATRGHAAHGEDRVILRGR